MVETENRGMGSYVFLLLLLALVLAAMIACIVLLRQIDKNTAKHVEPELPAPYVIPRAEAAKPANKLFPPPPPF